MRDPFQVLGLERGASAEDIKSSFRKLAKKHHPDANPDDPTAEERFKEISQAYETLTREPQHQPNNSGQGFGFEEVFQHDFFNAFRQHQEEMRRRHANADILTTLEIDLETVFKGGEAEVRIGTGEIFSVKVPRGIHQGQRLRVPGGGLHRDIQYPPGDLYIEIIVRSHPRFRRVNDFVLIVDVEIDSLEAILGGEVEIEMIDGELVIVPYAKGVQHGGTVIVPGRGLPNGEGVRGNLIVAFLIVTPTTLTRRHAELVDEIRKILPSENPTT
jgi:molecular chaperone DnaJ